MIPSSLVMTSYEVTSLDFTIFFNSEENLHKIKPECLGNVQIFDFLQFDEENWKNYCIISQKLIFEQT